MTVSDGTESAVQPDAPETPTSVPAEPTDPSDNLEPKEPEGTEPEPASEEELEEFDWEGKKVLGPKGLKDGVLRQSDYSKKTLELKAEREQLAQQRELLDRHAKLTVEEQTAIGRLSMIEDRIAGRLGGPNYELVDWDTWQRQNPQAAQAGWMQYQRLKDARDTLSGEVQKAAQQRTQRQQQETETRLKATLEYATKNIKGWNPELDTQITEFAQREFGLDREEFLAIASPKTYAMLHRAWLADQLQKQPQTTAANPNPAVTPLVRVQTRSSPGGKKSLAEMSMDEFVAERKKQLGR